MTRFEILKEIQPPSPGRGFYKPDPVDVLKIRILGDQLDSLFSKTWSSVAITVAACPVCNGTLDANDSPGARTICYNCSGSGKVNVE
jgi:hypothetical protein